MKLSKYIELINIPEQKDQLVFLGYDPDKVKVSELSSIISKEININTEIKYKKKYIKINGRKFYVLDSLEEMTLNDFSIYKSIVGYIYGDSFDEKTNETVEVPETEKIKRLFQNIHKILALTTYEKRKYFKKALTVDEKVDLYLEVEVSLLFFFIQLFQKKIEYSVKNYNIYLLMKQKLETEEQIV